MNQMLTILVPTYERPSQLAALLGQLKDLTKDLQHVQVIISDNSESESARLLNAKSAIGFVYFVNTKNLGFAGNLIRLLTLCDSGYIWFLSDDDHLHMEATRELLEQFACFSGFQEDCLLLPFTYLDSTEQFNISTEYGNPQTLKDLFANNQKLPFVLFSSFIIRLPEWFHDSQQRTSFFDRLNLIRENDFLQIIIGVELLAATSKVRFFPDPIIKHIPGDIGRFLPSALLESELAVVDLLETRGWLSADQAAQKKKQYTANQIKHAIRVRAGRQKNSYMGYHQDFRALPFPELVLRSLSPQVMAFWALTLLPDSLIRILDRVRRRK
jgi:glycosyltransferase involved in cell wall biosynthesis